MSSAHADRDNFRLDGSLHVNAGGAGRSLFITVMFSYWKYLSDNTAMAVDLTITLVLVAGLIFAVLYQG